MNWFLKPKRQRSTDVVAHPEDPRPVAPAQVAPAEDSLDGWFNSPAYLDLNPREQKRALELKEQEIKLRAREIELQKREANQRHVERERDLDLRNKARLFNVRFAAELLGVLRVAFGHGVRIVVGAGAMGLAVGAQLFAELAAFLTILPAWMTVDHLFVSGLALLLTGGSMRMLRKLLRMDKPLEETLKPPKRKEG